jgi:hypothetical protein
MRANETIKYKASMAAFYVVAASLPPRRALAALTYRAAVGRRSAGGFMHAILSA